MQTASDAPLAVACKHSAQAFTIIEVVATQPAMASLLRGRESGIRFGLRNDRTAWGRSCVNYRNFVRPPSQPSPGRAGTSEGGEREGHRVNDKKAYH